MPLLPSNTGFVELATLPYHLNLHSYICAIFCTNCIPVYMKYVYFMPKHYKHYKAKYTDCKFIVSYTTYTNRSGLYPNLENITYATDYFPPYCLTIH